MKKLYTYKIDWQKVSEGFGLTKESVIKMHNDGRIMGRFGEFIHMEVMGGSRQNEKSSFDVMELDGVKTEVRSITKTISFAASKEVGSNREVTEEGFQEKMNSIDRFVGLDIRQIEEGDVTFIEITKDDINSLLPLNKDKKVTAQNFYEIYDRNQQNL